MKRAIVGLLLCLLASPVLASGPVPGTDNAIELTQSGGGTLVNFYTPVKFFGNVNFSGTVSLAGSSLTTNTLPKFNGTTFANSNITDDATTLTLNTATTVKNGAVTSGVNFLNITGTLPASTTGTVRGAYFNITSAGSTAQSQNAFAAYLNAGYTGSSGTFGAVFGTAAAGTATNPMSVAANFGMYSEAVGSTTGTNVAVMGNASTSTGNNFGGIFLGAAAGTNRIGSLSASGAGGTINIGAIAVLGAAVPSNLQSAALVADNGGVASPIAIFRDNSAQIATTGATATVVIPDGGGIQIGNQVLTSATMTAERQGAVDTTMHSYLWTTAMVNTALGAGTTGDITVATLPAKTVVRNAYVVITEAAAGPATLTVACGRTGAAYIDYIVASDAKAAANTVYGDVVGERGSNLTGYDLPSYTAQVDVKCHFIAGDTTDLTAGQGRVILETNTSIP